MAVEAVGARIPGQLPPLPGPSVGTTRERGRTEDLDRNQQATESSSVRMAPERRAASATAAVAANNHEAAASATFLAGEQGGALLSMLAARATRGGLDVRL